MSDKVKQPLELTDQSVMLPHDFEISEHEEPIETHELPSSKVSEYSYCFSNGEEYVHPVDRYFREQYYNGFSERDRLLDDAITRGADLHCDTDLWRVYDDAILNYGLNPIDPYEWLFKYATLNKGSVIISSPRQRVLIVKTGVRFEYYDFIHGQGKAFARYARPIE